MALYTIPATNIGSLREKIAKLNKKAIKLGCDPITFDVVKRFTREVTGETGLPYDRTFYEVNVDGIAPQLNGFVFVAKVEPHEKGNIVKCLPNETAPEWAWSCGMNCHHCKTNRQRNEVFIVRNVNTGEFVLLGRNCLADYLGGTSPEAMARRAEFDIELGQLFDEEGNYGSFASQSFDTVEFVCVCRAVSRCIGFVTRKMIEEGRSYGRTTGDVAYTLLASANERKEFIEQNPAFGITKDDLSFAKDAIAWAQTLDDANDYLRNLKVACSGDTVDVRSKGIAASVVPSYLRIIEQAKEKVNAPISEWVGTVGGKVSTNVTVNFVKYLDGNYGVSTMIHMNDNHGNVIVWFASGELDVAKGDTYALKGTIKKLDERNGVKQTIVTRCKLDDAK